MAHFRKSIIFLVFLFFIFNFASNFICLQSKSQKSLKLENLIKKIEQKIQEYQIRKSQNFTPPFKWEKFAGLFESNIRANIAGGYVEQKLRNSDITAIFDNNMFASGWIVTVMLEAYAYGSGASIVKSTNLNSALDAIQDFHDKNNPNAPIMTFWPQTLNATYNIWQSTPTNVRYLSLYFDEFWGEIEKDLDKAHLRIVALIFKFLKDSLDSYLSAFQIPPDFDDTYLNLGLGATLKKAQNVYPDAFNKWSQLNQNMDLLVNYTVKYSYNPFDKDPNKSLIDPRTYFFARPFLLDAQKNNQTLSLITTWIQNIDEQRDLCKKGVSMPFNLNNVDVTVSANSIYGIASASLYDINQFQSLFLNSNELQQVFLNTTKFIAWAINTNYTKRPDLAQVYYPSNFNFLWYTSRTLFLLSNELNSTTLTIPNELRKIFEEAHGYLQDAFEHTVTVDLYKKAKYDNDQNERYFDDFLGLNDTNIFDEMKATGEDRIFSTSQAINILIATWTYQDEKTKKLVWKSNTPSNIKYLIDTCVNWLVNNIFNEKLKPLNAFFSGSVKGFKSLPFLYPVNFAQNFSGSNLDPTKIKVSDLYTAFYGVQGIMDENLFEKELNKKHFGYKVPINFDGYNKKFNFFPFWSSKPYTYASALLALAQYNNIDGI